MRFIAYWGLWVLVLQVGCYGDESKYLGSHQPFIGCTDTPVVPPSALKLDPFYAKYLDASGIPILSSANVADVALQRACQIVGAMVSKRDDIRQAIIGLQLRVGIIAEREKVLEIPEYRDLPTAFPESDWNRFRGLGATLVRKISTVGEENLLCHSTDYFRGESILVFTFSHVIRLGARALEATFDSRLNNLYDAALKANLWSNTYAAGNPPQYFAEGVQNWFDANREATPADGLHNAVNTRVELRAYDPDLAAFIAEYLPEDTWRPRCQ